MKLKENFEWDYVIIGATCSFLLVIMWYIPLWHDYLLYTEMWQRMLDGESPWSPSTYGPFFMLFQYVFQWNPFLPKVAFLIGWLSASVAGYTYIVSHHELSTLKKILLYSILFLHPVFLVFSLKAGTNDGFVFASCVFAYLALKNKYYGTAGFLLACGALMKFIPAFLVPIFFISLREKKIHWKGILSFSAVFFGTFLICYLYWGLDVLQPILTGSSRDPKLISIFYFLQTNAQTFPGKTLVQLAIEKNGILVIVCTCCAIFWSMYRKISVESSSLLVILTLLTFYKVGHMQFFGTVNFFIIFWLFSDKDSISKENVIAPIILLIWLGAISLLYNFTYLHGEWEWVRHWSGLPTFIIEIASIFAVAKTQNSLKADKVSLSAFRE